MKKNIINSLQVFRGFAALAVVCHHATLSTSAFIGKIPDTIESLFNLGQFGVDFFFVLSGFIIMYTHFNDEHTLVAVKKYTFKRLLRIFPAYIPISLLMIASYYSMPTLSAAGGRQFSILSSLLLIPSALPPALSVAWTLIHELLFYILFLSFFISRKFFSIALMIWAIGISLSNYFDFIDGWLKYPFSILNLEFMFGVLSAWYIKSKQEFLNPYFCIWFGIVISLVSLTFIFNYQIQIFRLALALGLSFIVVGYAIIETINPLIFWSGWLLMGNASYSIYLIHNPLLSITQRLISKTQAHWSVAMLLGVCFSVIFGISYYFLIEKTAIDFSRKKLILK